MDDYRLCESEYRFMLVVWEHQPLSSGQLVKRCAEQLGWKKPTTYTVLRKLCQRGVAQNTDSQVRALVSKEQVQAYESEHFIERTFSGSLPQFLVSFLGQKTISAQEADAIKRLIDEHKEG